MERCLASNHPFTWPLYRHYSINCTGDFAFTGLKMAGPDMRATVADFFAKHNLADVTVTSNYGINSTDRLTIQNLPEVKEATFGYFQDVKIKNQPDTLRVFSQSDNLSSYELIKGHFPKNKTEVALSYLLQKNITWDKTLLLINLAF